MSTKRHNRFTLSLGLVLASAIALSACSAPPPRDQPQPGPLAATSRDNDAPPAPPVPGGIPVAGGVPGTDNLPPQAAPMRDYPNGISEGQSSQMDVSPPLRDMKPIPPGQVDKDKDKEEKEKNENPPIPIRGHVDQDDPVVQESFAPGQAPSAAPAPAAATVGAGFEGINFNNSSCNCAPPDTNGDVGVTHYVQTVNSAFAVYAKATGALLYGPAAINTVWRGFGGACETRNDGDPVLLYDSLADRWVISQFTASSPYNECIAVSQTGDPTGAWNRYAFQLSTTSFPDYPKLGVWPDGYYMSVNWFTNGTTYGGPKPYVFDRAKMLAGQTATFQTTTNPLGSSTSPMMPADLDGATSPAAGTPGLFVEFGGTLDLYKFNVNWSNGGSSSWAKYASIKPAGFTQLCTTTRSCIPQPNTNTKLDGLGDRLMNRLVYRNQGAYESLLLSHAASVGGKGKAVQAGVRWYEIRNPISTPSIYQQGTYAPADGNNRWMSSIAMDKVGNIAIAYSASSGTSFPSIRATGRLANDALGAMTQGETILFAGTGSQSGVSRWGDYSNLSIDPSDGCTFWFTTEYNNSFNWYWGTRITSFKLPNCQ